MKRLLLTAISAMALFSCTKESPDDLQALPSDAENLVTLSFKNEENTKAFFDPAATAESWEKNLTSVSVLVFTADGNLLVQRNFTPSEVSSKTATFAIPNSAAGSTCEFYVVANRSVSGISTKAELLALTENNPVEYNGTFAEVSTSAKRSGGFVMTGMASKALAAAGTKTDVTVNLKRTVAKVAVQTATTAEFSKRYLGKVRINSAVLSKAASKSFLFAQGSFSTGTMNFTHTQSATEATGKYNNLFYVPENGTLTAGSRVMLTLNATYDRDGNFSTTADQVGITYPIELTGEGTGQLARNGYYRVQANIDGLTGADASATITVAEWETPVTQSVNLGQ